jgi:hypothetical protein
MKKLNLYLVIAAECRSLDTDHDFLGFPPNGKKRYIAAPTLMEAVKMVGHENVRFINGLGPVVVWGENDSVEAGPGRPEPSETSASPIEKE